MWLLQIPKPALLKGVGMSPGAGPAAGGNGYSRGGSVEYEGPSGYAQGGGQGMPEGGASQYMGGGALQPFEHAILVPFCQRARYCPG